MARDLIVHAQRTEAERAEARLIRNGVTWADRLATPVRSARQSLAFLHGLGWQQLTEDERPEVLQLDSELRRLGALARDNGCLLLPSEQGDIPGDLPPSMTPD